jgi:hypothetical protein
MRLCHPPDGSTSPKYKLLCFKTTKQICKEKNALAFNRDRCCHLVLCLWLIPFHYIILNYFLALEQFPLKSSNHHQQLPTNLWPVGNFSNGLNSTSTRLMDQLPTKKRVMSILVYCLGIRKGEHSKGGSRRDHSVQIFV